LSSARLTTGDHHVLDNRYRRAPQVGDEAEEQSSARIELRREPIEQPRVVDLLVA
jgi:hypothetical protein